MNKNVSDLKKDLEALKQELVNVRKALVSASKRARKFHILVEDRKKMTEVKGTIDQIYKNTQ